MNLRTLFGGLKVYEWTCFRCGIESGPFLSAEAREADLAAHVFEVHLTEET